MPLVILHHLLNVSVQLANKMGFKQNKENFYGKGNENHEFATGILCIRESYQQLRGLSL
jgi:hypothetical protein